MSKQKLHRIKYNIEQVKYNIEQALIQLQKDTKDWMECHDSEYDHFMDLEIKAQEKADSLRGK